ncbi:uncharacterized protein AMSG_02833 [Thecamonas trahens ATCC 50062]|uniref:NADH-ubiquinone oxidoreductase 21kDa subunit N-terminal domain-containing protein n=1 Tax=Thecamonas trahens ATCC 50062 TaxID=461836 RepID=A0A0L0D2G3_THETB|nr:hypothetical protein AMSG_02833 [Thecamonas trahens ATCC 50062]KNC46381.1 hypothetical protein AMSG_02833 [Thecamonas trahens ATCC 50062]|eukprot:XP_013760674.1 hypothetical protein AMSG_02833 [Thecamonas trahens ATCC 50062]
MADAPAGATPYPVVNAAPNVAETVANFSMGDVSKWALMTGLSLPFGWAIGKPIRMQTMVMAGSIGFVGGFMWAYQNAAGRLMGTFENKSEVKRHYSQ